MKLCTPLWTGQEGGSYGPNQIKDQDGNGDTPDAFQSDEHGRNGEMDNKTANTIILGCNAVLSAIRTDEQQRKIDELERILSNVK